VAGRHQIRGSEQEHCNRSDNADDRARSKCESDNPKANRRHDKDERPVLHQPADPVAPAATDDDPVRLAAGNTDGNPHAG
jgi:hypothetical protein